MADNLLRGLLHADCDKRDLRQKAQEAKLDGQTQVLVGDRIRAKLQSAFDPVSIEVIDESHKHAGHAHAVSRAGTAEGVGETHFKVKVVSEAFKGKNRVDRHRAINELLRAELDAGVHALAIEAKAPGE